jgi:23S rRNA pseudouridine2605 synthase
MNQRAIALSLPDKQTPLEAGKSGDTEAGITRLQVYLAHSGVASRRACEQIILDGHVTVNGSTVTSMGSKVSPGDIVCVDGKRVQPEERKRYVILNKPAGYVCSLADEKGRPVAADILKAAYTERLYNVGRLDMYSSGAILFTNDGQFASIVGHPSAEIEKEYIVEASLPFQDKILDGFTNGIRIDNVYYKARSAERLSSRRMRIVLIEGKNREIRKVLEFFGIRVKNLIRVRIGPVALGELKYGEFRDLTDLERDALLRFAPERSGEST